MLNIKQEALAYDLGEDWNQKKISMLEQKEVIEESLLKQISVLLKIPVEAFQNFDEEQAINVIANTYSFQDFKDNAVASGFSYQPSFNAIDKIVQFYDEKITLYERMLKEKDEMMSGFEKLISK
ncbi:hypothetical protein CFS9_36220 [Flavobacterium sp. CFS9]|uniref:Helix-turn-helix domain-containing protein n=2 Tax=Flavobacterium sp. CFS9 TaxID=3143118 RepID=A0AAT9H689_9FLAO